MGKISNFEDLVAWKKARELTNLIYQFTRSGLFERDFALRDQIRRAAISVQSNIAEGFERDGNREFIQFLANAKGSCGEVRCQLQIASDQNYLTSEQFSKAYPLAVETSKVISGLIRYLKGSELKGSKFADL
jgi:four helix bundle protein